METSTLIAVVIAVAIGGLIGWLVSARRVPAGSGELEGEIKTLREQVGSERQRADANNEKLIAAESERAAAAARAKAAEENQIGRAHV